jgi:hypothetical protein
MLKIVQMFGGYKDENLMDGSPDQEMQTKHLTVAMLSQRRTRARRWQAAEATTSEIQPVIGHVHGCPPADHPSPCV